MTLTPAIAEARQALYDHTRQHFATILECDPIDVDAFAATFFVDSLLTNCAVVLRALGGEVGGTLHGCRSDVPGGDCGCLPMWVFPKGGD